MANVWVFDDERMQAHKNGGDGLSHPERPARLEAVREAIAPLAVVRKAPRPATDDELLRVHPRSHVDRVAAASRTASALDPDTACSKESDLAARLACGSVIDAVDAVCGQKADRAFCAVRPPGHHARPSMAMGFCLYATMAVAAEHALTRDDVERVAILDFDVHHGNGTQEAFYSRGDVLVVNWHQFPFYPGTGAAHETGEGAGKGATVNVPLAMGDGDAALLSSWDTRVRAIIDSFGPDLLLVSAGFDGDARDPLGGLNYSAAGYAAITERIVEAANELCRGRVVSALEGGYAVDALAEDVRIHVDQLR